jgi:hypothetical protein
MRDMAAAARPGPSDARVPCALCGGLIHPIAGKCKHCKADLSSYHAARPAANTPLPALHLPRAAGASPGHAGALPAHAAAAPAHAAPAPVAGRRNRPDAAQPVLPPRPTTRGAIAEPPASGWRSWPVIVIALAMVAIVVAVVLMVWPMTRHDADGKHAAGPPPAPERMQTVPEVATPPAQPPSTQGAPPDPDRRAVRPQAGLRDPWAPDPTDPGARAPGRPAPDDTPGDDVDDVDVLKDPFSTPHAQITPRGRRRLSVNSGGLVVMAMAAHLCRKVLQCGTADPAMQSTCSAIAQQSAPPPANCPAAARCLAHIDTLGCDAQPDDLSQIGKMLMQVGDCAEASRC